jgi:hypothetical protein
MPKPEYKKHEVKSVDEVSALHSSLLTVLRSRFSMSDLAKFSPNEWWKANPDQKIGINLIDPKTTETAWREQGGAVTVFPLKNATNLWASWYEVWWIDSRGKLVLLGVSLTFWSGHAFAPRKEQLIRAEWDHLATAAKGSGQPHWQIDHPVGFEYKVQPMSDVDPSTVEELKSQSVTRLEELTEKELAWQNISSYHLGMRVDWAAADATKRGWQHQWRHDCADLREWLRMCVDYLSDQVINYPAKEF